MRNATPAAIGSEACGKSKALRVALAVATLVLVHLALAVHSLVQENPTVDEVAHLPAGITYWQTGTFRLYNHNPPLVKLIAALPVLAAKPRMQPLYQTAVWKQERPNRLAVAHLFTELNTDRYFELFTRARLVMPLFSIVAALVIFAWSARLYGASAGLLSLALWCFCPNVLAHCRLVTTDVAAAAVGVLATFSFWLYLRQPSWPRASAAGLLLGLAELTKFSLLLFYIVWPVLWAARLSCEPGRGSLGRRIGRGLAHGTLIVAISILVIDAGYGFEAVGMGLGDFPFASGLLTRLRQHPRFQSIRPRNGDIRGRIREYRVNRFEGTLLEHVPAPLPREYLLGFDDQKLESDGLSNRFLAPREIADRMGPEGDKRAGYPAYLDGELSMSGWWYYYFFALGYKTPEGTLALLGLSLAILAGSRRARATWFDEFSLLAFPVALLVVVSFFSNICIGLRYTLPIFPFVFVSAGKVVPWAAGLHGRARKVAVGAIVVALLATVASTVSVHPHYLAYFNTVSGGPLHGSEHLVDSNLDWGQDLVNLRHWLREHAPGERVGLAYWGQINPRIFGMRPGEDFPWFLPPARPGTMAEPLPARDRFGPRMDRPRPGLYAVSASLLRGLSWRVFDNDLGRSAPYVAGLRAFDYFQELTPIGHVGFSLFLYRLTEADAAKLARHWQELAPATGRSRARAGS